MANSPRLTNQGHSSIDEDYHKNMELIAIKEQNSKLKTESHNFVYRREKEMKVRLQQRNNRYKELIKQRTNNDKRIRAKSEIEAVKKEIENMRKLKKQYIEVNESISRMKINAEIH
jgi:hypothetical protein